MQFKRKVARNRGNARIWIEGKKLTQIGWTNGKRFDSQFNDDNVVLTLSPSGDRKVAGNPDRPIIDINTAKLNSIIGAGSHYLVTVSDDCETITITSDTPTESTDSDNDEIVETVKALLRRAFDRR